MHRPSHGSPVHCPLDVRATIIAPGAYARTAPRARYQPRLPRIAAAFGAVAMAAVTMAAMVGLPAILESASADTTQAAAMSPRNAGHEPDDGGAHQPCELDGASDVSSLGFPTRQARALRDTDTEFARAAAPDI